MNRNFLNNYFIKVLKIQLRPLAMGVFFYSNYSQIKTAINPNAKIPIIRRISIAL